jgi:hypothetical protein
MSRLGLVLLGGTLGCHLLGEPTPNVGSPNHHAAHGLEFDYPGNWTLKGEVDNEEGIELYTANVESSGNAIAMVQQFKPALELDVEQMMIDVTAGMKEGAEQELGGVVDYSDGSTDDVQREFLGETRSGKEKHFTLGFLGEKVAHTMQMYPVELEDRALILYMQIPDEDRAKAQPGFDQIFASVAVR